MERKAAKDAAKAGEMAIARVKSAAVATTPPREEQPSARLTMPQLFEIERMSAQGMRLEKIAQRLAIPLDVFEQCMHGSNQILDAYIAGRSRGEDIASGTILNESRNGDVAASKYWLERVGDEQWKPKAPAAPSVVVNTGPVYQPDMAEVDRRFARQSALLDGRTIDVEADGTE
jgi:hypothetical protein